ncbi:MAG: CHAP domain-containing protein [Deltaproteobacteria bacterium]|nr:CHAP domain-containing protein [Deltaproteobacteria bacterium]
MKLFPLLLMALTITVFPSVSKAVYSCGGVEDTCPCGASNPYPCCDNGGNCTWYAWHSACCNWEMALPGWGNANTWAQYAQANANYEVLDYPVVGSIAARTLGTYGHVAFVIDVSGTQITVEEENCCSTCAAGVRTWTYDSSYFDAGFIIPLGGVVPPECTVEINHSGAVIDDLSDCFEHHGQYWWDDTSGTDGHSYYTYATDDAGPDSWGSWRFNVVEAGNYEISVFIPSSENALTVQSVYTVTHSNGETDIAVDQSQHENEWVSLGSFWLDVGTIQNLRLNDNTGEEYDLRRVLMYDAVSLSTVVECSDECSVGEVVCEGDTGFRTCGNYDGDDCLEWSTVEFCSNEDICIDGVCQFNTESCVDECSSEGYSCFSNVGLQYCGNFDQDSCLEYGTPEYCPGLQVCSDGVCVENSDAGPENDTSDDAGFSDDSDASGCSCTHYSGKSSPFSVVFLLLGLGYFLRRSIRKRISL